MGSREYALDLLTHKKDKAIHLDAVRIFKEFRSKGLIDIYQRNGNTRIYTVSFREDGDTIAELVLIPSQYRKFSPRRTLKLLYIRLYKSYCFSNCSRQVFVLIANPPSIFEMLNEAIYSQSPQAYISRLEERYLQSIEGALNIVREQEWMKIKMVIDKEIFWVKITKDTISPLPFGYLLREFEFFQELLEIPLSTEDLLLRFHEEKDKIKKMLVVEMIPDLANIVLSYLIY